jgi:hypothetical protein
MTNSSLVNKKVVKKTFTKIIKKTKYRYYNIGTYGSNATKTNIGMIVHDRNDDVYYLYKYNKIVKQISMEEIIKYSLSDGYTQSYKLFEKKDCKPLLLNDNKFTEVIEKKKAIK